MTPDPFSSQTMTPDPFSSLTRGDGLTSLQRIINQLAQLCPCVEYTTRPITGISLVFMEGGRTVKKEVALLRIQGRAKPEQSKDDLCNCADAHRAGCQLVHDLLTDSSRAVLLKLFDKKNGMFNPEAWKAVGPAGLGWEDIDRYDVLWNPDFPGDSDSASGVPITDNNRSANIGAVLGHELTHAHDWFFNNALKADEEKIQELFEKRASQAQNQVYEEIHGEPGVRRKYRTWDVPPGPAFGKCDCERWHEELNSAGNGGWGTEPTE